MQFGNVVDQFHDIGALQIFRKNISGAFLFIDLLQDLGYIRILAVIQVEDRAAVIRQCGQHMIV